MMSCADDHHSPFELYAGMMTAASGYCRHVRCGSEEEVQARWTGGWHLWTECSRNCLPANPGDEEDCRLCHTQLPPFLVSQLAVCMCASVLPTFSVFMSGTSIFLTMFICDCIPFYLSVSCFPACLSVSLSCCSSSLPCTHPCLTLHEWHLSARN